MKNIKDCFNYKKKPIIVAEMSGNHNNSLKHSLQTIEAAAESGVDAIKFQTYKADSLTIKCNRKDFVIRDKKSPWFGKNLYELYRKGSTPWEWHKELFNKAKKCKLIAFSTPFDISSLNFLKQLNPPCYKIASFENTFHHLIKKVSLTKKPIIISTGMASIKEIEESVKVAKKNGAKKIILLKCSSNYPARPEDMNLKTLTKMKKKFNCEIGLSDHTLGIGSSIAAVTLGARLIEKHFTLSKKFNTVDSSFSLEPDEMKKLVDETLVAWKSIGNVTYSISNYEKNSKKFRRSLYFIKDLKKNEKIKINDIKAIRPGFGAPTKYYNNVIGKKVNRNVARGTALKLNYLKKI